MDYSRFADAHEYIPVALRCRHPWRSEAAQQLQPPHVFNILQATIFAIEKHESIGVHQTQS